MPECFWLKFCMRCATSAQFCSIALFVSNVKMFLGGRMSESYTHRQLLSSQSSVLNDNGIACQNSSQKNPNKF